MNVQETEMISALTAECLVCSSHRRIPSDEFHGHEWCETCKDTTNHIEVKQEEPESE